MSCTDEAYEPMATPYERVKLNRAFAIRGFITPGQSLFEFRAKNDMPIAILKPRPVRNANTRCRLQMDRSDMNRIRAALVAIG